MKSKTGSPRAEHYHDCLLKKRVNNDNLPLTATRDAPILS